MNNVMLSFIVLIWSVLPFVFAQKSAGPFYVVNEGFYPRTFENEFIKYVTVLKPMEDDWEAKTINGWFHVKHRVKKLGFRLQSYKESGKQWLVRGLPFEYPNLCSLSLSAKQFMSCFSGKLIEDPCSLDAGNYTLTNYNFEQDLRDTVGKSMFFGHFRYSVELRGIADDGTEQMGTIGFNMTVWIKDVEHKQAKVVAGRNKSSQNNKGNQTKNKSDKKKN